MLSKIKFETTNLSAFINHCHLCYKIILDNFGILCSPVMGIHDFSSNKDNTQIDESGCINFNEVFIHFFPSNSCSYTVPSYHVYTFPLINLFVVDHKGVSKVINITKTTFIQWYGRNQLKIL